MVQNIITQGFSTTQIANSTGDIVDVNPAPSSLGIPIGSKIYVFFDKEMDISSINSGTFLISKPNTTNIFSPGLDSVDNIGNLSISVSDSLESTISFLKADSNNVLITEDIFDTLGSGELWRTVAVLTPSFPLLPNTQYTVIVSGNESLNNYSNGVNYRTIFDPVETKTGTGSLVAKGVYTGTSSKTYTIEITKNGSTGTAEYIWWENSNPIDYKTGVTTTGDRKLENGLIVSFSSDGIFNTGDTFAILTIPVVYLNSSFSWNFTTGNGAIQTPPSSSSTSGVLEVTSLLTSTNISGFGVSRIVPASGAYGIAIEDGIYNSNQIVITFGGSSNIVEDSLIGAISLYSEHALGNDETHTSTGNLDFEAILVDNILTITITPEQLYVNNIVVLKLDRTIENEAGDILGEDYISYFSTVYTPLYTSKRRVALDIGSLIQNIPEETIMLAILEASVYADSLTFQTIQNTQYYQGAKREFVSCYAEYLLVSGMMSGGAGGRLSKTLGDLHVSRDGTSGISDKKKDLQDCMSYWQIVLESGGAVSPNTSLAPGYTVKGAWANDAMVVHRQWEPMSRASIPAANSWYQRPYMSSRRGLNTFRKKH